MDEVTSSRDLSWIPEATNEEVRDRASYEFRTALRVQRQILAQLFAAADNAETLQGEVARVASSLDLSADINLYTKMMRSSVEEVEAYGYARDAYAGVIAVVFSNMLKRLKKDSRVSDTEWSVLPKLKHGRSMPRTIKAIADNFRHYDDWSRTDPPTSDQIADIRVIADLVGVDIAPDGAGHPFGFNLSWIALNQLCGGEYESLEIMMRTVSDDLFAVTGSSPSIWTRHAIMLEQTNT